MWHAWVKAYRDRHGLTHEQAAAMLGIEARTIRRWETGASQPSLNLRSRLSQILVPSPAHQFGAAMKALLELSSNFIMLFDEDLRVVAQSQSHAAHMHQQYSLESMAGQDWRKYMPA